MEPVIFQIIPASPKMYWVWLIIAVPVLLVVALTAYIPHMARNTFVEVSDKGMKIRGGMYGRFIARESLVKDGIRTLNLKEDTDHRTKWKTNGIGMPGYKAGWFRLRNREKALLFVSDQTKVVYIPTTQGYAVMLSPTDPEGMVAAMRAAW